MRFDENSSAAIKGMALLFNRMLELYKELGITKSKLTRLTLDMVLPDADSPHQNFPCLSTAVKAAETRYLLPVIFALLNEYSDGCEHHVQRSLVLKYLMDFYTVMDSCDVVPSVTEGTTMRDSVHNFLVTYQTCGSWAHEQGLLL